MSEIKRCRICGSRAGVGCVGFKPIVMCLDCSNVGDAAKTEEEAIEAWNKQNDRFGKTVFLTREEAEQALKGGAE